MNGPRRDARRPSGSSDHLRTGPVLWAMALGVLFAMLGAGPAAADPAGPTDYRSEIVGVQPAVDGLRLRVIGGDAFLELAAPAGAEVVVQGYGGEPYLRFESDGAVQENRRSPTTHLNQDRFGGAAVPPDASPTATPDWRTVASDGTYAWHDHRIHWMLPGDPPGLEPGQQVLQGHVPLTVDGRSVAVEIRVTWLPSPSWVPALLGLAVGVGASAASVVVAGRRGAAGATLAAGLAALGVAAVAHWSVPPETGPSVAPLGAAVVAAVLGLAAAVTSRWRAALVLAAAVELLFWAYLRRAWLSAAILPTDLPASLDRAVTAGVGTAAVVLGVSAVRSGALGPWWSGGRTSRSGLPLR